MKYPFVLILSLAAAAAAFAADHADGGAAGAFTLMAGDGRAFALGNAGVALDGLPALYHNPAGLASLEGNNLNTTYRGLSLGRRVLGVGYGRNIAKGAAVGVSWTNAHVDGLMGRTVYGNETGEVANSQNLFVFGLGRSVAGEWLRIGFGGRMYYSVLDEDAGTGYGVDAGVSSTPRPWLTVSAAARDAATALRWTHADGTETIVEHVPTRWAAGAAVRPWHRLTLLTQADAGRWEDWRFRGGAEFYADERLSLRAGYDDGAPTLGGAIVLPRPGYSLAFDYAWGAEDFAGGYAQTVSVSLSF